VNKTLPLILIALSSLALGWVLLFWQPSDRPAELALDAPDGGDFTLQSAGGPVALEDFRGKVVLLYFGYTFCPDVCPTNLGFIAAAMEQLAAAESEQVQVLFVSVDPERDTLEKLQAYAGFFHPRVIGITGTPDQVAQAAALYGAAYRKVPQPDSATGYLVDHSANTYLLDRSGKMRRVLAHATAPDEIAAAVRAHL